MKEAYEERQITVFDGVGKAEETLLGEKVKSVF